ncbi:SusC/RagA family TonB-linked outer membrane protein [Hymenobacter chitinivorans]|uniref:TonB-linked SusC/RagA family outer membrane protein n=1 Tax=Hymenobacter chitinivorans DSM 11115 TaxID=1121954 RepID=A0A2M9AQE3_9BACT|nr:TonB-dependent receptor [Hymenobacter chitinivorans]PJJ47921.1 TonB-linked SusC/RagA family outer membrane protein [Hymenobacter chitinivorans DSM 11115]
MKKILFMSFLLMFTLLQQVTAQNRNISGRVTDRQSGEGLPGVTVLLKGTTNGVSTNSDGTYTLSVPSTGGTLVFSSIGYIQTERAIGTEDQLNIGLAGDSKQLSEVVVTGYGTQERRDVTGSIASVQGEAVANLATPSFAQQLAGRAAGVQVQAPSGLLGQQPRIQIRGTNSISSGTSPLIVVDGQPIFTGNTSALGNGFSNALADINPADIESYEVLKDGSATAIYGSRAANGVILITTKKGRLGKTAVSYDTYIGVAQTLKRYDVLGAEDFVTISNEKQRNASATPVTTPLAAPFYDASGNLVSTDWQKEIFRTGFQQNHVVSVSGANEKTNYYFSAGYTDQDGVVKNNSLQRFTFRSNLDTEVKKWLRLGMNLGLSRTQTLGLNTNPQALSGNVTNALSLFPNVPARNPDGTPYQDAGGAIGQGNNATGISFAYTNIIFPLENNIFRSIGYRILGNTYLEVEPVTGLRLRSQIGTDTQMNDDFQYLDPRAGDGRSSGGSVFQGFGPSVRWNLSNTATYSTTFAEAHKINAVIGTEYQKTTDYFYQANGTGLSDRALGPNSIVSGTLTTPTIFGGNGQNGLSSYFGRLNYSFKDRYLISATLRADKLSSLPAATRLGYFPGGSLGWRVSEEPFFKSSGLTSFWSDFKLRGSYAQVGNTDLGSNFPYAGLYGAGKYGSQGGLAYTQFGNDRLKWETSKKTDFGIDLGFLNNRINLNVDYYRNNIDGAILAVRTPLSLGVPGNSSYRANVGSLYNRGLEVTINTQNIQKEGFTWSTSFNFSTNKNQITALSNNEDIVSPYNITRVGESIGALYGYDYQGVNPSNGYPIYKRGNGTLIQASTDRGARQSQYYLYDAGNPGAALVATAPLATSDKFVLGQTNPKYFGGLSNTLTFKGFDLDVFLRYSGGNKIFNQTRQQLLRMDFVNNSTEILDRWQKEGDVTSTPKVVQGNGAFINQENNALTRFVEKGDFIRLQNVTLGYTLPQRYTSVVSLSRVRLFVQAQNIATITGYKGVDPEVNSNYSNSSNNTIINQQAGVDYNSNPQQRVFTGGINVAF